MAPKETPRLTDGGSGDASGRVRQKGGGGGGGGVRRRKKNSMSKTILSPQADPIEKSPGLGRAGVVRSGHGHEKLQAG